jgi:hypothetical protein
MLLRSICLFCFLLFSYLQGEWTPPDTISIPGQNIGEPHIAVDPEGNATAVWSRYNGSHWIIQASTKPFEGSWQTPADLSNAEQDAEGPQIAIDSEGNATAVWYRSNGSNWIIQASTKLSGGSWQTPADLSDIGQDAEVPHIALDSEGNATVVWYRSNGSNWIIQASTKLSGGLWQHTPDDLSDTGPNAVVPQIAVDSSGNATAVWFRFNGSNWIIQASTKPSGGSWQHTPDDLSEAGHNASSPQVAVDAAGNAIAVWQRSNGTNTIIQASTKLSEGSWLATPDLSDTGQDAAVPQIAVDSDGNATAIWQRSNGSNTIIQTSTKAFSGSWTTPNDLSASGQNAQAPQIAVDAAGNATAVWQRSNGTNSLIQASTKLFGSNWQTYPDDLSEADQNAYAPQVASDSSHNVTIAVWWKSENFTVQAAQKITEPTITRLSPNFGPVKGGKLVTVIGTNFYNVTQVAFGSSTASSFTVTSPTTIDVIAPPGTGTVDVRITTSSGTSAISSLDQYTYIATPRSFHGTVEKKNHHRWLLRSHWKPSQSPDIVSYRIYKGSKLVDIIPSNEKLHYSDYLKWRRSAKKFKVSAFNSKNQESKRKKIKIED